MSSMNLYAKIGLRIQEIRTKNGLSQQQLADKAGVVLHTVQYWESGRANLTLRSLIKLSRLLGVSERDFFLKPRTLKKTRGRPSKRRK